MIIDGWNCEELFPGTDWSMRTAKRGPVEFEADSDGVRISESHSGYSGATGSYNMTANIFMWLAQAVRL